MSKIFEFVNNNFDKLLLNEIKMLIYYDSIWCFPSIGFEIMESSIEIKIDNNIKNFIEYIIQEMNKRNIDPNNWEDDFNKIINSK